MNLTAVKMIFVVSSLNPVYVKTDCVELSVARFTVHVLIYLCIYNTLLVKADVMLHKLLGFKCYLLCITSKYIVIISQMVQYINSLMWF